MLSPFDEGGKPTLGGQTYSLTHNNGSTWILNHDTLSQPLRHNFINLIQKHINFCPLDHNNNNNNNLFLRSRPR
jgi:hypothetical protein